ncbi:MAG: S8 family serine peptidase [Gammaproteobacteria bacterium]|nr:S8 family serine peptidase [Gammaproteobacteria bacterium]
MSSNRCHWARLGILIASLVALSSLVWIAMLPSGGDTPPSAAASPERIFAAGAARIVGESQGVLPPPVVQGARSNQIAAISVDTGADPAPTPPDGYSFVDHFGDMLKAPIRQQSVEDPVEAARPAWLDPINSVHDLTRQAESAGRDWSFGWIRLAADSTRAELAQALEGTRAEILGSSGRMIRARLPRDAAQLEMIASLNVVDGIGTTPREAKLAAFVDDSISDPSGQTPVYVTLLPDDPDGRWRRSMENLGAVVGGYDPVLRVYRANASPAVIEALAAADFVLAVEPIPLIRASHDTAVPAMGADAVRAVGGEPGVFSGFSGTSVPIAVMDTGLNINHLDIGTHRASICGANFADNSRLGGEGPQNQADDLWIDAAGHGTHVTGTAVGNGFAEPRFAGMAPGVRHIRFAKVLDSFGVGLGDSVQLGMDYLATASGCSEAGRMSEQVKPLIVNMSLSESSPFFEGRDLSARKLDSTVWNHRQLYVVAQSNFGPVSFSDFGAAKNSLSVGAAKDDGGIASFSSHGPTADGRLAPNVVGTGVRVYSARGGGSRGGYRSLSGTSMSSPAVAGIAALLMDAVPAHKEQPALTRARLMASAIRPDPWLADDAAFPSDNTSGPGSLQALYGMGKVSARTAALSREGSEGWGSGSATTELEDGEYAYHDIEVPEGTSRLDVVMTWDEPPADAVASTVLNDLDLWLDQDSDCEIEACGEHSSRSRVDSAEWIIVRDPEAGTYRTKVLAHRVYTAAPRAAVAWTMIRGTSTPTLSVEADKERIEGDGEHELRLTVTADAYVAAGARLQLDCRTKGQSTCNELVTVKRATVVREDGLESSPEDESLTPVPGGYAREAKPISLGTWISIGEIAAGEERKVNLGVSIDSDPGSEATALHFTASAWNGRAGSVSVGVGSADVPVIERPANDDFAAAKAIEGEEGSEALDLLHATPEPGEPDIDSSRGRPMRSVWYTWTAPGDGPYRFKVPVLARDYRARDDIARYDLVQVFQGDELVSLEVVASSLWQVSFFAEEGQKYHIRVSGSSRGAVVDLSWSPGGRAANDDFADAVALDGESGGTDGSSAGATLQPGESLGGLTATTWFRWTAPRDGLWLFGVPNPKKVLVFEGDDVSALRLVSNWPGSSARLVARGGREYRIAVAETDLDAPRGSYRLSWYTQSEGAWRGNDRFEDAEPMTSATSSEHRVHVDAHSTVEPDEPSETGVRTKWWLWEAPEDNLYTWRIEGLGEAVPIYPKLRITMFRGSDLELAAQTGPGAPFEFLLDATDGERYWIAAGLGNGHPAAYELFRASGMLVWGATPDNDEVANAAMISGASGSVSGSNAFATGARGERSDILGRSTLWWTYEAPATGWVRFAVDGVGSWVLGVHRDAADGFGGLETVASNRWQRNEREVLFKAREGVRYTISLGVSSGKRGGEFTLRWDEADDPRWLRYVGRLADGDRDGNGNPVAIRSPGDLASPDSGDALYLASGIGLQIFEPDPATGELNYLQLVETDFDLAPSSLLWDSSRDRLLADNCGTWRSFAPDGNDTELEDLGELSATADPARCAIHLLMAADGSSLYRVSSNHLEHFDFEESGGLRFVEETDVGNRVHAAVLSGDGEHLYVVSNRLLVFERNAESGELTQTDFESTLIHYGVASGPPRRPLAITDDDAYLFVFDRYGARAILFSLEDPLNPERLSELPQFWQIWSGTTVARTNRCRFADTRGEDPVVDVLCPGVAYTAHWDPEVGELGGTDHLSPVQSDRFNGVPIPEFDSPTGFAVSSDDRYVYLATPGDGILTFERGAPPDDATAGPDLVVDASVDNANPESGATFTLSATVHNRGDDESGVTTLRFYRSVDSLIVSNDAEVGSTAIAAIAASRTSDHSIGLTASEDAGTYHYGACVDSVTDESNVGNNCSAAVAITVAGGDEPDLVAESPSVSDETPAPGGTFTLSVVVRNQGDGAASDTTLRYYRSSNTTITGRDEEVGTDAVDEIAASASSNQSIDLTAPSDAGTYHYGACADDVANEGEVENNCSTAVTITVADYLPSTSARGLPSQSPTTASSRVRRSEM